MNDMSTYMNTIQMLYKLLESVCDSVSLILETLLSMYGSAFDSLESKPR